MFKILHACRVCSKNWHTDYQNLLDALHILTLEARRKVTRLCFMYKLVDSNSNLQLLPTSQRTCPYITCSTHPRQLENISGHFAQFMNSFFFPKTITDWNILPSIIASCNSISTFKSQLYKFIF